MDHIVGRDGERAIVARFVAAAGCGPAVLTIDGTAGIGKTALWQHALHVAAAAGSRILTTAPGEQESQLTFTALTDLLQTLDASLIEDLPVPQRVAVEAATLRAPAGNEAVDERAIATGLVTLLRALATHGPVLIAIDDVQWLDAPSRNALQFAIHRLEGAVGVLACRRVPSDGVDLGDVLPAGAWREHIELGGLSIAATYVLVHERLGIALPRARLNRLFELAQGNPLLALELVRAIGEHGESAVPGGMALPDRLGHLIGTRLAALPDEAAAACLAVACAGRASLELLRQLGLEDGLRAAEEAGVLTVGAARVDFVHPLLSAASQRRASAPQRREMHARLAEIVVHAEARARHLALADPAPQPETANALDAAAEAAARRGSISAAIDLGRLALERTPPADVEQEWRRRIALAANLYAAGESLAAADVLADRSLNCPAGSLRAQAELLMIEVAFHSISAQEAARCAHAALEHAEDPVQRARALLSLDVVERPDRDSGRPAEALRCLAELEQPDGPTMAWAGMSQLYFSQLAGEPVDVADVDALVELERQGRVWRSSDNAASNRPVLLTWIDEPSAALAALDELERRAEEEGNEGSVPYFLGHRCSCLISLARFREAAETAARHMAHAEATGQDGQTFQGRYLMASVAAYIGDLDAARAETAALLETASEAQDTWLIDRLHGLLGVIELARGDNTAARAQLDLWFQGSRRSGELGPAVRRYYVDYVEALLACGDQRAAHELVDWVVAAAEKSRRRAPEAAGLHGRALLAADAGDLRGALGFVDRVLAFTPLYVNDLERGRALLLAGVVHRRLKEKAAAQDALTSARALFETIGAVHFLARTDAELARIGRRSMDRLAITVTERRVAELAAQGLTNREVAERAFISTKTVEANLARVYRKLGIRSRAELGAWMAANVASDET